MGRAISLKDLDCNSETSEFRSLYLMASEKPLQSNFPGNHFTKYQHLFFILIINQVGRIVKMPGMIFARHPIAIFKINQENISLTLSKNPFSFLSGVGLKF